MLHLVLIDLDGTLLRGASSERRFVRYLIRKRMLGPSQGIHSVVFFFRWYRHYGRQVWKKNKAYLSGLQENHIRAVAAEFALHKLQDDLVPGMIERIRRHHSRNHYTVLLTGTLEYIALPIADYLGIKEVCATTCVIDNGLFTPEPPSRHPIGKEKLILARNICKRTGACLSNCTVYADADDDIPLLSSVSKPVAVNPSPFMYRYASLRDWEILAD